MSIIQLHTASCILFFLKHLPGVSWFLYINIKTLEGSKVRWFSKIQMSNKLQHKQSSADMLAISPPAEPLFQELIAFIDVLFPGSLQHSHSPLLCLNKVVVILKMAMTPIEKHQPFTS